jgi:hypothetical protein
MSKHPLASNHGGFYALTMRRTFERHLAVADCAPGSGMPEAAK